MISEEVRKVLERSEWTAIGTSGVNGGHIVGVYSGHVFVYDNSTLLVTVTGMKTTSENLKSNSRVQLLFACRKDVPDRMVGFSIFGSGEIFSDGLFFDFLRQKFNWIKGCLVIKVDSVKKVE
jgi:hypothetical protein